MKTIGMIIPDGTNQYFSGLAQAFQKELSKKDFTLIVLDSSNNKAHEITNIEFLRTVSLSGLIFVSVGDNGDAFKMLSTLKIPLLVLDREIPLENADFLMTDDRRGVFEGLRYLSSQGHEKIAFISGDLDTEPGRVRQSSFVEWFEENDFNLDQDLLFEGDFLIGSGKRYAKKILRLKEEKRPTAIFASNDIMAIGLLFELKKNGFNVPKDFSILGYDDILFSSWIYPKLTTIKQDHIEIAKAGVELLLSRLREKTNKKQIKIISPSLVIRDSVLKIK